MDETQEYESEQDEARDIQGFRRDPQQDLEPVVALYELTGRWSQSNAQTVTQRLTLTALQSVQLPAVSDHRELGGIVQRCHVSLVEDCLFSKSMPCLISP